MDRLFQKLDGSCPYCGGIVNIVEGLVYEYTLDKDGLPYFLNSEQYKVAAYCKHCDKCLYVLPNNAGGYTVYPDYIDINTLVRSLDKDEHHCLSALGNKFIESEDNPFITILADDDCPF